MFIASGEGLSPQAWNPLVEALQEKGFGGIVLPFPSGPEIANPDEIARHYQAAIDAARMVPPLMIAHSLSTLCALNFLESYSLAGLVLLNPVPSTPKSAVRQAATTLLARAESARGAGAQSVQIYYGHKGQAAFGAEQEIKESSELPLELLRRLTLGEGLLLEPGAVPTLVILTPGDAPLLGKAGSPEEAALLKMCGAEEGNEQTLLRLDSVTAEGEPITAHAVSERRDVYVDRRCVGKIVEWVDALV